MKKIMVIRHAEKPRSGEAAGVDERGAEDKEQLTVTGWQRAGALARFFNPLEGRFSDSRIHAPDLIFASGTDHANASMRPRDTVKPLAALMGKTLCTDFVQGNEAALVSRAKTAQGDVLVCWHHQSIPQIAGLILGDDNAVPGRWDEARFDLVWIFDEDATGNWTFQQVPQLLLAGDSSAPITVSEQ